GIVPISHQQDIAGPMARSVTDVAILLGIMQSQQTDYTPLLQRGALQGKRIGRDVRFFDYSYYGSGIPGDELTVAFANNALSVMQSLGARIVDIDTGDVFAYNGDELTALLYEFRAQIADYLATLTHTTVRTLADLIAFNNAHCTQEMPYYDQDVFLLAEQFVGYPYDLEQALNARQQPQLLGSIQPIPNGGFCNGHQNHGQPHLPHGKIF